MSFRSQVLALWTSGAWLLFLPFYAVTRKNGCSKKPALVLSGISAVVISAAIAAAWARAHSF